MQFNCYAGIKQVLGERHDNSDLAFIERIESSVRFYSRGTPIVFKVARGSEMFDEDGGRYLDFMSAAGSLNYGHNDPKITEALIKYLSTNGILQTLDFATTAKAQFLRKFSEVVLEPRGLEYKVQFTGPTGANAIEAAIKLARKCTGRRSIAAFTNAYHGVSLGALALTGSLSKRLAAGVSLPDVQRLPYDGYMGDAMDTMSYIETLFRDPSSGYEPPAAFIVEVVQGEGGLQASSTGWIRSLAALAKELGSLFIVDDIQAGCGRTGKFFSFECAELTPDIVCLSKSISGTGLPMAINLIRSEVDVWRPGEHNGTFRGNSLAFVGATAALDYWQNDSFELGIQRRATTMNDCLQTIVRSSLAGLAYVVGRGMIVGLCFRAPEHAEVMRVALLRRKILTETCGARNNVLKLLPALNIPDVLLTEGLETIAIAASELKSQYC
jgi:diaminobutyrate-2-oxoglutarate transaminase